MDALTKFAPAYFDYTRKAFQGQVSLSPCAFGWSGSELTVSARLCLPRCTASSRSDIGTL
jgi:hypothetical protein